MINHLWFRSGIPHEEIEPLRYFDDLIVLSDEEGGLVRTILRSCMDGFQACGWKKAQVNRPLILAFSRLSVFEVLTSYISVSSPDESNYVKPRSRLFG